MQNSQKMQIFWSRRNYVDLCRNHSFPKGKTLSSVVYIDQQIKTQPPFLEKFNDILSFYTKDNKHFYVMGGFNLYLL